MPEPSDKAVKEWTCSDVKNWLQKKGFRYVDMLCREEQKDEVTLLPSGQNDKPISRKVIPLYVANMLL